MKKLECYKKIYEVVSSCETIKQLEGAMRMLSNFLKIYGKCVLYDNLNCLSRLMGIKLRQYT